MEESPPPISVLLLRSPVPMSKGTDPYHDAFGSFCLPSFASSALESGASTPLPGLGSAHRASLHVASDASALDLFKTALAQQAFATSVPSSSSSASAPASTSTALPSATQPPLSSATGRRKGKFIQDQPRLMTHHLSYPSGPHGNEIEIEYCVTSFPILSHALVNQHDLVDRILHGCPANEDSGHRRPYRGVIATSQRAVEAYTEAGVQAQNVLRSKGKSSSSSPTQWNRIPFFAVGPATASALRSLPLAPWLRPRLVMGGEATGNGDALARYVVRHFSGPSLIDSGHNNDSSEHCATLPDRLLYLVGDKNATTIPDLLLQSAQPPASIPLDELQVYQTGPDSHFAEGCEILAKTLPTVVSRPPSRRPSQGSMQSRPGSRRPSGSSLAGSERGAAAVAPPAAAAAGLMSPAGVASMTSHEPGDKRGGSSVAAAPSHLTTAVGGSPNLIASPADLEPEPINPIEEESVLKLLRRSSANGLGTGSVTQRRLVGRPDWIVFFSPSGVNYALEEFRRRHWLPPDRSGKITSLADKQSSTTDTNSAVRFTNDSTETHRSTGSAVSRFPKVAVLGATTRAWIVEHLGFEPDAVAQRPGPKELREAIEAVEMQARFG
ncbi:hypothetical protein BCV70DRAFT_159266 [Testicularia cyperi]|uniref:Tetrapyrrole biosynthesis uroporphyrinogen III synthase domain-containing protein n=1 Tax=Testicularia cyperi TaxID=1882483 RepID=A0A317XS88_9BASI|nr:hypothetical protein BCV70DRAFT_159266 [Testicularia cyperi]